MTRKAAFKLYRKLSRRSAEIMFSRIHELAERNGMDGDKETARVLRAVNRYNGMLLKKIEIKELESMLGDS